MAEAVSPISQNITTITPEVHKIAPISGFTTVFGVTINPMVIVLVFVLLVCTWLIYTGVKKNNFNVWDLVQDVKADGTRVASVIKSMFVSAFLVSTWVVVDQEIKGTLTEGIFMAYLATWCASLIAKVVWDKPMPISFPVKP